MSFYCFPCGRVGLTLIEMESHTVSKAHVKRMGERNPASPGYCAQCTRDCFGWANLQIHLGGAEHRKVSDFLELQVVFKIPASKRRCSDDRPRFESTRIGLLNETYVVERPKFPTPEVVFIEDSIIEEPPFVIVLDDTIAPQVEEPVIVLEDTIVPQVEDTVILIEDSVLEVPRFPRIRHYNVDLDTSEYDE